VPPKPKTKGRRNRTPDKLTPEVQKVIVDAVAGGVPRKYAAARAGVTPRAVELWVARGAKEKKGPYASFFSAMKKAEADRLAASVARIGRAAAGGQVIERTTTTTTRADGSSTTKTVEKVSRGEWTADAWFLERCHPDEFAGNKREVKELREQLVAVLKAVAHGRLAATAEDGTTAPRIGGEADPSAL
jgi:hypothetical protein